MERWVSKNDKVGDVIFLETNKISWVHLPTMWKMKLNLWKNLIILGILVDCFVKTTGRFWKFQLLFLRGAFHVLFQESADWAQRRSRVGRLWVLYGLGCPPVTNRIMMWLVGKLLYNRYRFSFKPLLLGRKGVAPHWYGRLMIISGNFARGEVVKQSWDKILVIINLGIGIILKHKSIHGISTEFTGYGIFDLNTMKFQDLYPLSKKKIHQTNPPTTKNKYFGIPYYRPPF